MVKQIKLMIFTSFWKHLLHTEMRVSDCWLCSSILEVGFHIYGTNDLLLRVSKSRNQSNALTWKRGEMFFTFLLQPGDMFILCIHCVQTVLMWLVPFTRDRQGLLTTGLRVVLFATQSKHMIN